MKSFRKSPFYIFVALLCLLCAPGTTWAQNPSRLTIRTNALSGKGMVYLTLFRGEKGFPDRPEHAVKALKIPLQNKRGLTIIDVAPGTYAVAAFYDADGNGKLTKNLFGAPSEPYAFSNNVRGVMSAPSFDKAAVTIAANTTINLELR